MEINAQQSLNSALHFQEQFWREKAGLNWFSYGDRNTSYFHKMAKVKHSSMLLSLLRHDDRILDNQYDIECHVIDFNSSLFSVYNNCTDNGMVEKVIPSIVSAEDNVVFNLYSYIRGG